jgi:CBS domain-containing protein
MFDYQSCSGRFMAEPNVLASRVSGGQSECPMHQRVPRLTVRAALTEKQTGLHCIDSSCRLSDALKVLVDNTQQAVLVLDADRLVGVFSLQDFAHAATMNDGTSAMALSVSDVMTRCNCAVSPNDSAQDCLHLMHENNLHFIPVLENDHPIALLSKEDLQSEIISNYEKIFRESALDQQILFLRGTYSC